MSGGEVFASVSLLATLAYVVMLVTLHVLPTGYNPVRHAVSDYAVGRYGSLFRIGLWISSFGVLTLAVAFILGIGSPPLPSRALAFLFLIPVSRIGMTFFPTDLEGKRLSRNGRVHYLFAILAFTFTYLVISETTTAVKDLGPAPWLQDLLNWSAWAVAPVLFLVVVTMFRPLRRIFALVERLFLLTTNVWFLAAAATLITRSR
jgi:hypothetical protein